MKKIMMTLAAVAVAATMNAQIYVGGEVGFETTSVDGNSTSSLTLMPEIGYNLDENLSVGISFGYGEDSKDVADVDAQGNAITVTQKNKRFIINPYARYTFMKLDKVNLFIDGGLSYAHYDNAGAKNNQFGIGVRPGVAVNLNYKLSFVAHFGWLGYKNSKDDYEGAKAANTFGFDLNSKVSFGMYYNF
jgi:hypothetical protein